mgnify:FL=1
MILRPCALIAAVGFVLNWGVSKVDPKGRTGLQMLDVGPSVEDLKDKKNRGLAVHLGMGDNPKKLETLERVGHMNVKSLYKLYKEAQTDVKAKKEIPFL